VRIALVWGAPGWVWPLVALGGIAFVLVLSSYARSGASAALRAAATSLKLAQVERKRATAPRALQYDQLDADCVAYARRCRIDVRSQCRLDAADRQQHAPVVGTHRP
jgi:hypothetical protein